MELNDLRSINQLCGFFEDSPAVRLHRLSIRVNSINRSSRLWSSSAIETCRKELAKMLREFSNIPA